MQIRQFAETIIAAAERGAALPRHNLQHTVKALKNGKDFGIARRLLAAVEASYQSPGLWIWIRQQRALCTYRDTDLPVEAGLDEALQILSKLDLVWTDDSETLCLAGAIHKRRYEVAGDQRALKTALRYYGRAFDAAQKPSEKAYAAVNTAFICDLLADAQPDDAEVPQWQETAEYARRWVVEHLVVTNTTDWWTAASVAEAWFGLGDYRESERALRTTRRRVPDWERESTARQLAAIARLRVNQGGPAGPMYRVLAVLLPPVAARALVCGRVGLALSGGGYRAALFHVGVLARLAELDLLRHVETLSCVSGGSIVGVLYYLVLKQALESKAQLTRADYVEVVTDVENALLKATQKDLRTRAFLFALNPFAKTRTEFTAELMQERLFSQIGKDRLLRELKVRPFGARKDFNPKRHNWSRADKVPIILINATTLNSGHNWQFAATWMGEPPTFAEPSIDATDRLRRLWLDDAKSHRDLPLALAVAASAAVPGVFPPVELKGLYPDRVVRLSDGGVHDNQGIFGLLEQDCGVLIVSDASGQLDSQRDPPRLAYPVLQRANDILMQAVRRQIFRHAEARRRSGHLQELTFVHMKDGLSGTEVTAVPPKVLMPAGSPRCHGIGIGIQQALATIRTDLDNFSVNEARALMCAGYRIAASQLTGSVLPAARRSRPHRWGFLKLDDAVTGNRISLLQELRIGRHKFFRWWRALWVI